MQNKLAKYISGITSPYLMVFVFGLWAIGVNVHNLHDFLLYGSLCIFLVLLLPLLYILTQVKRGRITDIHVALKEQRSVPFTVATIGAVALSLLYLLLGAPTPLIAIAFSLVVSGITFGLISTFWKISIHAAAFTGSVVIVGFVISVNLFWLLLFLPLVLWARLVREKHNLMQVLAAAALNGICVAVSLSIILR